ncbi:hypothetical protein J4434_05060 [Candidatus Woesearchaeota archaeon]|nr:hypothetical protein [Candidatus Woesearchaeota archaeon]
MIPIHPVYLIAGFGGGIFLFIKGFFWLKKKRLIENIPTSKIRSIAMGLVEVYGEVVPWKGVLKSPFSNKECVYYKFSIQEHRRTGKHSSWVTVKTGEAGMRFYLKDNTDKVLVDPTEADVNVSQDYAFSSGFGKDPPLAIKQFLKVNNMNFESFLGLNKQMKYHEYFIAPKDKLYILGTADDNPFVKDGNSIKNAEDIMIQKGKNKEIYMISDKDEKGILRSLTWKAFGGIFGGAVLTIGSLIIILIDLKLL